MYLKRGRYYYGRNQEFIGDNLADAMLAYGEREAAKAGKRPLTFGDLGRQYAAVVIPNKAARTREDNMDELSMLLTVFDKAPLSAIEPHHLAGYRDNRFARPHKGRKEEPRLAKTRANREIALFSAIWNWGRETGRTALPNPCPGVKRNKETGRDRYVEDEELRAEWLVADEALRDALDLHYLTGQRPSDMLKMRLTDIKNGCLEVRQGKTKKPLRLALQDASGAPSALGEIIERIKSRAFPAGVVVSLALVRDERGQPLTYWQLADRHEKARALTGVHFQLRDLRAKHGTDRAELEGILAARKALGHSSVRMTERYVRDRRGEVVEPMKLRTTARIADKKNAAE
jgi:integrase